MYNPSFSINAPLNEACSPLPAGNDGMPDEACPKLSLSGTGVSQHHDVAAHDPLPYFPVASPLESAASCKPLQEHLCTHTHEAGATVANHSPDPASQYSMQVEFSLSKTFIDIRLVNPYGSIDITCSKNTNNAKKKRPSLIYAGLAACAISSMENKRARFHEICSWIVDNFSFFEEVENQGKMSSAVFKDLNLLKIFQRIEYVACKCNGWALIIDPFSFSDIFHNRRIVNLYKPKYLPQSYGLGAVACPGHLHEDSYGSVPKDKIKVEFSQGKKNIHINLVTPEEEIVETFEAATHESGSGKPDLSYSGLIVCAICINPNRRAALKEIRSWILENFNYFNTEENTRVLNSNLRTNLSHYGVFENKKDPLTGKKYWTISRDADAFKQFIKGKTAATIFRKSVSVPNPAMPSIPLTVNFKVGAAST